MNVVFVCGCLVFVRDSFLLRVAGFAVKHTKNHSAPNMLFVRDNLQKGKERPWLMEPRVTQRGSAVAHCDGKTLDASQSLSCCRSSLICVQNRGLWRSVEGAEPGLSSQKCSWFQISAAQLYFFHMYLVRCNVIHMDCYGEIGV